MAAFENFKENLTIKYKIKDLSKAKMIIGQQINKDLTTKTIRVNQSTYIRDLYKEESLTNCNAYTILMKVGYTIEINKSNDYDKAGLVNYQRLIGKLIYLAY